jgi:hypothetical protein
VVIDVFTAASSVGTSAPERRVRMPNVQPRVAGRPLPKLLSTDHDPLVRFHRWRANLRVREIEEVKSVPDAPVSHPFVERLIGTIRREYLDRAAIACIARSRGSRQRSAQVRSVPLPRHWITTGGSGTAGACSNSRSPPDYDFATER